MANTHNYVYEFDLTKFFDTVPWFSIKRGLLKWNFPKEMIDSIMEYIKWGQARVASARNKEWIDFFSKIYTKVIAPGKHPNVMNDSYVWSRLEGEPALNVRVKQAIKVHMNIDRVWEMAERTGEIPYSDDIHDLKYFYEYIARAYLEAKGTGETKKMNAVYNLPRYYENFVKKFVKVYWEKNSDKPLTTWKMMFGYLYGSYTVLKLMRSGVPQGMGLSPLAACAALAPLYSKYKGKITMYMDDGLIYSNSPIDPEEFEKDLLKVGCFISPDKSKMLKRNGVWINPMTFLGTTYDPSAGTLSRKDSTIKLPKFPTEEEIKRILKEKSIKTDSSVIVDSANRDFFTYENHEVVIPKDSSNIEGWIAHDRFAFGLSYLYGGTSKPANRAMKYHSLASLFRGKLDVLNPNISSKAISLLSDMVKQSRDLSTHVSVKQKVKLWERITTPRSYSKRLPAK